MPYTGEVDFDKAKHAANLAALGKKRRSSPKLKVIEDAKRAGTVHIFSVSPWPHEVATGSTGIFKIPACAEGVEYVEAIYPQQFKQYGGIPGVVHEEVIKSESEMSDLYDEAEGFAREVVGDGRGRNPEHSLRHSGVFVSQGDKPTKQELYEATTMLHAKCAEYVAEARLLYSTDRKAASMIINPKIHFKAAQILNLSDEPWMLDSSPAKREKCRRCGVMVDSDVSECPNGHIINQELYLKLAAEDEAVRAKAKGK